MSFLRAVGRWLKGGTQEPADGTGAESTGQTQELEVHVLGQAPLVDAKRMVRYLASVGVDSRLRIPPGGCGT